MEEWLLPQGFSKHKVAIDWLLQQRFHLEVKDKKKATSYKINPKCQSNIQKHLVNGVLLWWRQTKECMRTLCLNYTLRFYVYFQDNVLDQICWTKSVGSDGGTKYTGSNMKVPANALVGEKIEQMKMIHASGATLVCLAIPYDLLGLYDL
ncbi:uncharacterized protein LOC141847101 [Curcuma longa]|uniref:uncharacterized protein LOC141847101 n=1 Tax=Curcuma longa TaxID=136217 RepID=UPI003D9E612E